MRIPLCILDDIVLVLFCTVDVVVVVKRCYQAPYSTAKLCACWPLAQDELIRPLTGFVFRPAGWHATLLTNIMLVGERV